MLSANEVTYRFHPAERFLGPVDLPARAGTVTGIIGPNGAGKSTLLRVLAGIWTPWSGQVRWDERPLADFGRRARARLVAFLPQHPLSPTGATVEDIVRLGRYPHRGLGLFDGPADLAAVAKAMHLTDVAAWSGRPIETLSGGEARRVHLAAALAQQPQALLLDEPTANLDPFHQLNVLKLLRRLAAEGGMAIVLVLHDLDLASRFCDAVLLLHDGQPIGSGTPAAVLRTETLGRVYRVRFSDTDAAGGLRACDTLAAEVNEDAAR